MAERTQDVVVVGAGIVGLAVAMKILKRFPFLRVTLLEKEAEIAAGQTGHNSGVIHSGIYYAPGTLKALLCVSGVRQLVEFAGENGIGYKRCGKLIIATDERENKRLEVLWTNGRDNGIQDLELLDADGIRQIEPHARGLRAIHSSGTGVIDFKEVAGAMARIFVRRGK